MGYGKPVYWPDSWSCTYPWPSPSPANKFWTDLVKFTRYYWLPFPMKKKASKRTWASTPWYKASRSYQFYLLTRTSPKAQDSVRRNLARVDDLMCLMGVCEEEVRNHPSMTATQTSVWIVQMALYAMNANWHCQWSQRISAARKLFPWGRLDMSIEFCLDGFKVEFPAARQFFLHRKFSGLRLSCVGIMVGAGITTSKRTIMTGSLHLVTSDHHKNTRRL